MSSRAFGSKAPQLPHLIAGSGGMSGEIKDLRADIEEAFVTVEGSGMGSIQRDVFTNPALAVVDGLQASTTCTLAARTVTTFAAGGVAALAAYPRNVTINTTGSTPTDAPATAVVTGTYRGLPQTETLNVPQSVAQVVGTKPFSTVTSVAFAVSQGTDAANSIGFGAALGTSALPAAVAGGVTLVHEVYDGAKVTNGTLTAVGLYTPNTAPNGTHDYAVYYEAS
jgi:hypothetical protein